MNVIWVLVCDAAKARLFEARPGDPAFYPLELTMHEASRSKASELVGGRSGSRSSEGSSVHHDALAARSSPKDVEKEHFAHALASKLDQAMRSSRFRKWILVAPPHFLGLMRTELTNELAKHLLATVDKDLNSLDAPVLAARLHDLVVSEAHRVQEERPS